MRNEYVLFPYEEALLQVFRKRNRVLEIGT